MHHLYTLLLLALFGRVLSVPAGTSQVHSVPVLVSPVDVIAPLEERQQSNDDVDDEEDDTPLSFITKLAAIGDSYSAGIGAGDRLGDIGDWACSRYDHSYPYLVNNDLRLGDASKRTFQFKSCSGAVAQDVLDKQIPAISSGQQVILLSVGGNDAELSNILNQCIYQWAVLNSFQVGVAKIAALDKKFEWAAGYDWDSLGRGCTGQLSRSADIIASDDFSKKIDNVIDAAKKKLADDGMIYFTGYAKFFDEDYTSDCDKVSWSTWLYKAENIFQPEAKLGSLQRRAMNDLVNKANDQLKAAVKRAGDKVQFVDYDAFVGKWGGRYCEPGVDEATKESNTRAQLMFYELNSLDPAGTNPWKRSTNGELQGTFLGDLDIYAQITQLMDPQVQFKEPAVDTNNPPGATFLEMDNGTKSALLDIEIPNLLPDGYGRVFHPQILLHRIISNMVIWQMLNVLQKKNGAQGFPQTLSIDSCPLVIRPDEPLTNYGKCETPLENFEKNTFDEIANTFCDDHSDISKTAKAQYGQDDNDAPELQKWNVYMEWDPNDKTDKCAHSCKTIFKSGFGTPTECRYDSHTMAHKGSFKVDDCGTASFELKGKGPKATEEKIFDTVCAGRDDFGKHDDLHENFVDFVANAMCDTFSKKTIKKDDSSTYPFWETTEYFGNHMSYSMRAVWKDGCVLPNDKTEVSAQNPLPKGAPGADVSCYDLFFNNWRNCNNGGVGGSTQVGCIVYDFQPKWRDYDFCCR